jgi:hypothetical protein
MASNYRFFADYYSTFFNVDTYLKSTLSTNLLGVYCKLQNALLPYFSGDMLPKLISY